MVAAMHSRHRRQRNRVDIPSYAQAGRPIDLGCLSGDIVRRLAARFSDEELDLVKDPSRAALRVGFAVSRVRI